MSAAVLRVARDADTQKTFAVVTTCGCAFRLDAGTEEVGRRIMALLDHADEVNRGERGGCYVPQMTTGSTVNYRRKPAQCVASKHIPTTGAACSVCGAAGMQHEDDHPGGGAGA